MIVLDSDLLAEYSSHKPRASVALQSIKRLGKARNLFLTILLHFIRQSIDSLYSRMGISYAQDIQIKTRDNQKR